MTPAQIRDEIFAAAFRLHHARTDRDDDAYEAAATEICDTVRAYYDAMREQAEAEKAAELEAWEAREDAKEERQHGNTRSYNELLAIFDSTVLQAQRRRNTSLKACGFLALDQAGKTAVFNEQVLPIHVRFGQPSPGQGNYLEFQDAVAAEVFGDPERTIA